MLQNILYLSGVYGWRELYNHGGRETILFLFVLLSPASTYHMYGDKYLENPSQHLKYNVLYNTT